MRTIEQREPVMSMKTVAASILSAFALVACGQAGEPSLALTAESGSVESFIVIGSQDTFLKKTIADSATLALNEEKCVLPSGTKIKLQTQPSPEGSHLLVNTADMLPECEFSRGYVFRAHVEKSSLKTMFSANMMAFLDTIAYAEGTNSSYDYIFSFVKFYSFAGHPRRTICSGGYCSDASGRYQIKSITWDEVRRTLGLTDFSPESQDRAAVQLIRWRGGYDDVERIVGMNDFDNAAYAVRYEWASFPHSPYGQPTHSVSKLWSKFKEFKARY